MRLVVAAVIVDSLARPTRVLACRRSEPDALRGQWEFPGGKVEPGESPTAALQRELREELRVGSVVGDELAAPRGTWPINDSLELRAWWATVGGEPEPGDTHDTTRWLSRPEFDDVDWLPVDRDIVATLKAAWPLA